MKQRRQCAAEFTNINNDCRRRGRGSQSPATGYTSIDRPEKLLLGISAPVMSERQDHRLDISYVSEWFGPGESQGELFSRNIYILTPFSLIN